VVNLLDTPGHKDFCEDTYRVLTAVDAAIMVIDAGKGIESQTRKLFEVCRQSWCADLHIHEQARHARASEPLDLARRAGDRARHRCLCDELAARSRAAASAGVYDRHEDATVHLFQRTARGAYRAPVDMSAAFRMTTCRRTPTPTRSDQSILELEMLEGAGHEFDQPPA